MVAVGVTIALAILVDVVTLVVDRSVPYPWIVFIWGGLLLFVTQVVLVGGGIMGFLGSVGRTSSFRSAPDQEDADPTEPSPRWPDLGRLVPLGGAILVAGILGLTGLPALSHGQPSTNEPECPYAQVSHGSVTCVSEASYHHAVAGHQRAAASFGAIFLGAQFFGLFMWEKGWTRRRSATHPD